MWKLIALAVAVGALAAPAMAADQIQVKGSDITAAKAQLVRSKATLDQARTQESRQLLQQFVNTDDFLIVREVHRDEELSRAIVALSMRPASRCCSAVQVRGRRSGSDARARRTAA